MRYLTGKRQVWSSKAVAVGAGVLVLGLAVWGIKNPHAVERLFTSGLLFPVVVLAIRWSERPGSSVSKVTASSQQPSNSPTMPNHVASPAGDEFDLIPDPKPSLKMTLDTILSSTRQLVPYDIAEITLWDEEQQCCFTQGWGGDRAYVRMAGGVYHIDEGYTGWIIRHRRFLLVRDVQARHDVRPSLDTPDYPFQSYIGIPLQTRGRFVGTLELASYQKDAWLERDLEILQAVANQAVIAIENVYLYAETQRRAEQQAGLARIAALAGSTLDLDELLNRVMDETLQLLGAEQGVLLLYDEEQDALLARYLASARADRAIVEAFKIPTSAEGFEQSIFARGGSYFCNDIKHDGNLIPAYCPYIDAVGAQNFAGVALRLKERSIGELYLGDRKGGFGREDVRLLQTVAGYFASAIENTRLYDETRRRVSELTSLMEISATVSESLELEHALHTIASAALKVVGCQRSAIFVLDEQQQVLRLAMTQGLSEEYAAQSQALALVHGGRAHAVVTGEPLIVSDVQADESLLAFAPMSVHEGFRAFADFPLKRADRVIGMLSIVFVELHRFSEMEIELLTAFADQAAIAIENARLYTQADDELRRREDALRRRNRELATLYEAATATSSSLSLSDVFQTVADQMTRLFNATGCVLALWDHERNVVETLIGYNITWAEASGTVYNLNDYPATLRVLETRQPVVIQLDDPLADKAELTLMKDQGIQTLLILPLITRDRVLGLAKLIDDTGSRSYTPEEMRLAQSLAAQAAVAIENARLYEQAQQEIGERKRAEEALRRLQRVSREINTTLQQGHILPLVLEEADRLSKATHGAIMLRNASNGEWQLEVCTGYSEEEEAHIRTLLQTAPEHPGLGQVLRSNESLLISDVTIEEGKVSIRPETRSLLIVPIFYQESPAGLIVLESPDRSVFDQAALEFVEGLSAQAATAIGNTQRYYDQLGRGELLRRRADQLAAVLDVSRVLRSDRPLEEILEEIAYAIQESVGFHLVIIGVVEGDPPCRRRVAAAGVPLAEFERMKKERDPWSIVADLMITEFRVSHSYYIPAEQQARWRGRINVYEERTEGATREPGRWHPEDLLLVPLVGPGGDIQGLLSVDQPLNGRAPNWETVEALEIFAAQAALAIENARLFNEVRRFSQEMERRVEERTQELDKAMRELTEERDRVEMLYRITSQLTSSLDLDHVLNLALQLVVDAVGAKRAAILMLAPESGKLIYRASWGTGEKLPIGGIPTRFSRGEGLAGWVVENRKAAIVPDIRRDLRWIESRNNGDREYRSALAAPLTVSDEVLGVLLLFHPQVDHFNENHLLLVDTAAIQVASAINNAELYKLIFDQAERLGNTLKAQKIEATKSHAILEGVADGVIVADAKSEIILFNAAAERILGLPREKALGRSINEMLGLYGSQARDWMDKVLGWAKRPETHTAEEYLATRLEIGDRVVSVLLGPVLMESEFLGTVSAFRDVTAKVAAEQAKTEFVSTVSHELRTPMTSIKGYVELLLMGAVGALTDEQVDFLSVVDTNVDRLTILVNDLLDISRIESGRVAISPQVMRVEHVVDQVVTAMQARAAEQGLTLHSDMPAELVEIVADPDRVAQILTNLMANACNYTPPGGEVTISARVHGDEVYISVCDTGIGISEDDQEKIFERFFRADDSMVQDAPGTGLGLSIVQSLTEIQRGRVWVESELGEGSTFTVALPTAEARRVPDEDAIST